MKMSLPGVLTLGLAMVEVVSGELMMSCGPGLVSVTLSILIAVVLARLVKLLDPREQLNPWVEKHQRPIAVAGAVVILIALLLVPPPLRALPLIRLVLFVGGVAMFARGTAYIVRRRPALALLAGASLVAVPGIAGPFTASRTNSRAEFVQEWRLGAWVVCFVVGFVWIFASATSVVWERRPAIVAVIAGVVHVVVGLVATALTEFSAAASCLFGGSVAIVMGLSSLHSRRA